MTAHRGAIRAARSIVVKVGTTALTTKSGLFDAGQLAKLVDAIETRMKACLLYTSPSPRDRS